MRKVNKASMAFTGILTLFTLVICLNSYSYAPKVRLVPLLVGIATMIVNILVLVNEVRPIPLFSRLNIDLMGTAGEVLREESEQEKARIQLFSIVAWMLGFLVLIFLVGFYISIPVFGLAFLRIQGKVGWVKSLLVVAIIWCFIFATFELIMELHMFQGMLFGEILPSI